MELKINTEFKLRRVSHHNICKTIAEHTKEELKDLAIEARKSNNPILLECFDNLPSLPDLMADKTESEISQVIQNTEEPDANNNEG